MNIKYYLVEVWRSVEPQPLKGPYFTYDNLLKAARKVYAKWHRRDEDGLFYLRTEDGRKPQMGSFSGKEMEGE